ncbi:type II secretion system F family protein [candidate division KSB1 bacterium]|nr:type II secretion system F family protein [candidate division KSB1 bacterium]
MFEYRYVGLNLSGRPVQGSLFAKNGWDLKKRIQEFKRSNKISITRIEKKHLFMYRVQKAGEKPIKGEQRAFSQAEVQRALHNMGYQIIYVRRKLIDVKGRVPVQDVVIFIRLCADMLRQKFPYDEILQILSNDTENKTLRESIKEIHKDLKLGKEGYQVYGRHSNVFGRFATHMLVIATTSGHMEEVYLSTAKYLERDLEFKKSLRSALFMPMIVLVAIILTFLFYIMYIFPKTTGLLTKYNIEVPPMTQASMLFSAFLQNHFLILGVLFIMPTLIAFYYFRTPKGNIVFNRIIINLPVIGPLLHKSSIEIFSRIMHALYSGSGDNINVIKTAAEACRNTYIEKQVKEIVLPIMLREGKTFTECLARTGVFPANALNRFRAGEESGTVRESALSLADYYEREISYKMTRVVDWVNLNISILVTVLIIIITLISSEVGFVTPTSMGGQ